MRSTATLGGILQVEGLGPEHKVELSVETIEPGLEHVRIRFQFASRQIQAPVVVAWSFPARDIHAHWGPLTGYRRGNDADWDIRYESRCNSGAPVHCLHSHSGRSRLTFALSEARLPAHLKAGLAADEGIFRCAAVLFTEPNVPSSAYDVVLRLDARDVPLSTAVRDVERWWAQLHAFPPSAPLPVARRPVYSTWYSFFRDFDAARVEAECRIAHEVGCGTVAVDDGWQTDDRGLQCAHCGPWTASRGKIENMRAHVATVHDIGLKYVLWYSLPHLSSSAPDCRRFEGKCLDYDQRSDLWTLDPRFPDVREYLVELVASSVREWDLDGVRLDFIDGIRVTPSTPAYSTAAGRDTECVYASVDRLLSELGAKLRAVRPDVFMELRQPSIGPLMRKHAAMLRGPESPQDSLANRLNVADMRLIAGRTPVHSDMLTWNREEPVESAAIQLANVLFSVPQLSVRLGNLPESHLEMLRFYLRFWHENRDVFLDAPLRPSHPESLYTVLSASTQEKEAVVCYASSLARLSEQDRNTTLIVNATGEDEVVLEVGSALGGCEVLVSDCRGRVIGERKLDLSRGVHALAMPTGSVAVLTRRS